MVEAGAMSNRMKRIAMGITPALLVVMTCLSASAQTAPPSGVEATSTPLGRPHGVAYDTAGNLYIADTDQNVIRKVSSAGIVTTVAGDGEQGYAGDGGLATAALLDSPAGVAVDANGNIYIADTHNNVIREVLASNGNINTIAGTGAAGFSGDALSATAATLSYPSAVAVDTKGNVYIADTNNHRIREIVSGTINTVAGDADQAYLGDGVQATATGLDSPNGVAVDSAFNIYIGDTHNQRVRMVTFATGNISTLAGTGVKGFTGDGPAVSAALARPRGIAVDGSGNVYLADTDNNLIRTISSGNLTTIAGSDAEGFSGDGGASLSASLDMPDAVAIRGTSILFSDTENDLVRLVDGGAVNSIAGQSPNAESLVISGPASVAYGSGTLTATFNNGGQVGTGFVTFYDGEGASPALIGSASLSSNTATISTSGLALGTHAIVASYAGDANNAAIGSGVFALTVTSSAAVLITPTAGSMLGSSATFTWTTGAGVTSYFFVLGTTGITASDLYSSGSITATSATVLAIPSNGVTVYASLYSKIGGVWQVNRYTFSETGTPTAAMLTAPSPSAVLPGSSVVFTWTPGTGPTSYYLDLGTHGAGSDDLYNSGTTTATTVTANGLPTFGDTVYASLHSKIDGVWQATNYIYTEAGSTSPAAIAVPSAGALLGSSTTFSWAPVAGVTGYIFKLGTAGVGSSNLYVSGQSMATSTTASGIPADGFTVYATLLSKINNAWQTTSVTYTESGAAAPATLTSPSPGSVLGSSATFAWSTGNGATAYIFDLGTTGPGASDLYTSGSTTAMSASISGIPGIGVTVYATLYSKLNGAWQTEHFTYTESGTPVAAVMSSPTPGTVLAGSSATFTWTPGTGVTAYYLLLGTTGPGSSNLYNSGSITATSVTANGLPTTVGTLYATLHSKISGVWQATSYTYTTQ